MFLLGPKVPFFVQSVVPFFEMLKSQGAIDASPIAGMAGQEETRGECGSPDLRAELQHGSKDKLQMVGSTSTNAKNISSPIALNIIQHPRKS